MGSSLPVTLPPDVRREGERLLEVSLWCLGRDVRHEDNLLLRRGLARERIAAGQQGTSAYSGVLPGGGAFTLWGFGVLCRVCGEAVYVPRDGFTPLLADEAHLARPLFQAAGLGPLVPPATPREHGVARVAVAALAEWLAGYEEWVVERVGAGWRRECIAARRKASPVPVEALAAGWRRLAERVITLEQPVLDESFAPVVGV